jgi:hypothetical protein
MRRDPTYLFDYVMICLMAVAFSFWLIREGYEWEVAVFINVVTLATYTIASMFRWDRTDALPLARRSARFSRRNQLKANAIAAGTLLMIAPGWDWGTIVFFAVVLFGFGNLMSFVEWLLWRRYIHQLSVTGAQGTLLREDIEGH